MSSLDSTIDSLLPPLLSAYGPPGREEGVRAVLRRALRGLGQIHEDAGGNLHLRRPGRGPRLLIACHMDAPGAIVTRVDATGLGRVALLGNRNPAELVGAMVRFDDGSRAMLGYDRSRAAKDAGEIDADSLFLETGLGATEARRRVPVGAVLALEDRPARVGEVWFAANLDNRAGCAAVVAALRSARAARYDLHAVFTAQSDVGARGAITGAYGVDPEIAVVVDVAHLDSKSGDEVEVGKGPCIGLKEEGYVAHPDALALAKRAAASARVKTQWLIREAEGSDARAIRATRMGVPTVLVAIPARKSGGAVSWVHARDVSQTAKLLAHLLKTTVAKSKGGRR